SAMGAVMIAKCSNPSVLRYAGSVNTSSVPLEASRSRGHGPCSSRASRARGCMPVLALAKKFLDHREQSLTAVALVRSLRVVGPRDVQPAHLVLQCRTSQAKAFCRPIDAGDPA